MGDGAARVHRGAVSCVVHLTLWCVVHYTLGMTTTQAEAITYRIGDYYGEGIDRHVWEITDADGIAAELYVDITTGEILNIEVRKDRRGEGLARDLYETAATQIDIYHAPVAHRTPEGDAFAEAVGGDTIECIHGCCEE